MASIERREIKYKKFLKFLFFKPVINKTNKSAYAKIIILSTLVKLYPFNTSNIPMKILSIRL